MTDQAAEAVQDHETRVDLVFEGGGVKGIALVGALSILEERGYQFQNLAGTSAGAIVATLVAAEYKAAEIREIIAGQNFQRFMDMTWEDHIPLVGQVLSIVAHKGIYEGKYFLQRMTDLLKAKNVVTFADLLRTPQTDDLRYRYKVQVIASDLTDRSLLVLPRDAHTLGIDNPDALNVAEAVRMSMSIPIFFEPVQFPNPRSKQEHLVVDGGMLSNFPVWLFDSDGPPEWPTFGLKLVEANPKQDTLADALPPEPVEDLISYIKSLVSTMVEAHDRLYLEQDQFVRTITIPTSGVGSTDFNLTPEQAQQLYDAGRAAAEGFLQSWNSGGGFPAYVAAFRQGAPQPRRERAVEMMRSAISST